ncbi:MAG: hypothetical protein HQ541_09850 [Mariniphaga sp.]|nr:hypothetical protein [Mariniphaga sp.]
MKRFLFISIFLFPYLLFAQKFEAENSTLSGGSVVQESAEASGGFYVALQEGNLSFDINLELAAYNIYVYAASPHGNKINIFSIDDKSVDFALVENPEYKKQKAVSSLKLSEGTHTVQITKSWGWINIDYIEFEKIESSQLFNINTELVTPEPTAEAEKLYQFMYDIYGKKIISGAMTLHSMDEINWLNSNTGKKPAIVGLDFMHCGRNYNWYNDEEPINDAKSYYNQNGIPVFCWHWRDPSHQTEEFYTNGTSFDISKIMDESSAEYQAMITGIDYISGLLKKLQDKNVPIVWRPLHEAAGGWFWWGAKGPEPCKKLFQIMYDRMVNHHGLKNLIWVWTREPNDDEWYPGDEYVDIVGRDIYREGDHSSQVLEFNDMNARYGGNKMITISECGSFPDVENLIIDNAGWLWYMPWYGSYVRDSRNNSLDLWKKMFAHEYVITLDEMPDLKSYTTNVSNIQSKKHELSIFPTIVKEELNIKGIKTLNKISIYNMGGILVKKYEINSESIVISTSELIQGMYLVKVDNFDPVKILKH